MRQVADGGGALQQPRAALRHLAARQAVVALHLRTGRPERLARRVSKVGSRSGDFCVNQ